MDGESEPNPAVAEEAGEREEPLDAPPSPQQEQQQEEQEQQPQQTTPPREDAGEAVSMETDDGATKEGHSAEENDDDVVLVGEEEAAAAAAQPSATTTLSTQDTPSADCIELDASSDVGTVDMSTAAMPSKTPSPPPSSSAPTPPPKPPTTAAAAAAEPIVIDDEEDSEQKDTSSSSPAPPGGEGGSSSSMSHSPGVLSSTEPDSEIRIASVTTLGSGGQKGSSAVSAAGVDMPPHPVDVQADMNLMITSVTSLQGGAAAVTAVRTGRVTFNANMSEC